MSMERMLRLCADLNSPDCGPDGALVTLGQLIECSLNAVVICKYTRPWIDWDWVISFLFEACECAIASIERMGTYKALDYMSKTTLEGAVITQGKDGIATKLISLGKMIACHEFARAMGLSSDEETTEAIETIMRRAGFITLEGTKANARNRT